MTVLINASNTSGLTITSDTSGNLAFQSNGTTVATISGSGANAGIQMGSTFAPAFSAYATANQTIPTTTYTKVTLNAELFDTNNNFDSTTNYRFTPTVAGYYQINAGVALVSGASYGSILFYKNGSVYQTAGYLAESGSYYTIMAGSTLVYMNGSTDYLELYAFLGASANIVYNVLGNSIYMNGFLARSA